MLTRSWMGDGNMGVLLKFIQKPDNCNDCPLCVNDEGFRYRCVALDETVIDCCGETGDIDYSEDVYADCPMVNADDLIRRSEVLNILKTLYLPARV